MAGMVRPLRDLGIDLSVATLKEYALSQGIEKSYSAMSQAEKMMLRYQYLMSQTGQQQGDFAMTSGSLANSMRILKAYVSEITVQIGVGFGAALRHAIIGLNKLMQYVLKASQAFATFMQTLFGKYNGGAKGVVLDGTLADADISAGDLADSAGSAADGLADADEEAKKLKKDLAVLPFDELNQLAKDREATSSPKGGTGGGSSIGSLGDFGDFGEGLFSNALDNVEDRLGRFQDFVDRWARLIKGNFNAKNWEGLGKAIAWGFNQGIDALYDILDPDKAAEKINPFLDAFTTSFNSFVREIHWETLGNDIGRGITILVNAFNRLLDPETGIDFNEIGRSLGSLLMGAIRDINWTGVGNLISNKFMAGWRIFSGFVEKLNAEDIGTAIHDTIGGAIEKFEPEEIGASLGSFVTKVANSIKIGFGDKKQWKDLGKKLGKGINAFLENFNGEDAADGINALLDALFTTIGEMLATISPGQLIIDIGGFLGRLDWGKIAIIAALWAVPTFIPALVGGLIKQAMFKTLLKQAITKPLASALTEAGSSAEVTTASSSMFGGLKSALIGDGIGAGVLQGGVYAAIVAVIGKLAELQDAMKGGNGIITEVGGAFDSYINQLYDAGLITSDTKDKLFDLKEQMEDDKITSEEFGTQFSKALQDSGISAETASGQVDTLAARMGNLTDVQIEALKSSVSEMTSTFEAHNTALQNAGLDGEEAFNKIRNAINMADPDIIEHGQMASQVFYDAYKQSGGDAVEAMTAVINKWEEMGLEPEMLKTAIDENLGEGTYDALVTDASTSAESVNSSLDSISTKVGETKTSVQSDLSDMRGEMTDLHKTSSTSATEIGTSQVRVSGFMLLLSQAVSSAMETARDAMSKRTQEMMESMDNTADSAEENGTAIPTNLGDSINENAHLAADAMMSMASDMSDSFADNFDPSELINDAFDSIDTICNTVNGYGVDIAEALKDGIESIDISVPHIEWSGTYTRVWTGANSYTDIPDYHVRWYARGGLFTRATIAGFGEAGDEAALPLENRRTMNRIANAIVDNSGGSMGMDEDSLSAAIARGYVRAMMSNQGNERPMNVYATLYTEDNEVLARAVQRGNRSMDYRNNATSRFN